MTRTKLYALVDANNFYASCEKIFRPDLAHTPLVVLSNNDGCIVARSKEAKALGIGMGEPYFKAKNLLDKHNVAVFSSNYALYGDISERMISVLESCCEEKKNFYRSGDILPCLASFKGKNPRTSNPHADFSYAQTSLCKSHVREDIADSFVDQYSIDEAFINLDSTLCANAKDLLFAMRSRVAKWIGIQVSIGLGQTRTLAKLANYLAKKAQGVYYLDIHDPKFPLYLEKIDVREVWGIGRKSAQKLEAVGIRNALQLQQADDNWVRKHLTVTGWNTVLELRGVDACEFASLLPEEGKPRHTLISSRSFSKKINDIKYLEEAISHFTVNATERLRREKLLACGLQVSIRTSKHGKGEFYSPSVQYSLQYPTSDTRHFLKSALCGLKQIYRSEFSYAKAGIMLFDIVPENRHQGSLLSCSIDQEELKKKSRSLMSSLDTINAKFGKRSIFFGTMGTKNTLEKADWKMKQKYKSQGFTSRWGELPRATCG